MLLCVSSLFILLPFGDCGTSFLTHDSPDQESQELFELADPTTKPPSSVLNGSFSPKPLYPWLENLVKLPSPEDNPEPELSDVEKQLLSNDTASMIRKVIPDDIPHNLNKLLNQTALTKLKHRHRNRTDTDDDSDDDDEDFDEELNKPIFDGEKTTIKITEDAGEQLHQHWIDQGISGLMATVATQRLEKASAKAKTEHRKCTRGAKSVAEHAKCVHKLIETNKKKKTRRQGKTRSGRRLKISVRTKPDEGWPRRSKLDLPKRVKRHDSLFRSFKRVNKESYNLLDQHNHAPFAILAKRLTEAVRTFKNKNRSGKNWQETLDDIRDEAKLMRKKLKAKKLMKKRMEMFVKAASNLKEGKGALQGVTTDILDEEEKPKTEREELLDEANEVEKQMTSEDKTLREPIKLIRQGVKLGMRLVGHNTSDFENKTLRMISPKFMSLVEDDDPAKETINMLSPSLFALHNGTKHETLSMTSLMNVFNKEEGHQEWMNFVFEASGVSDAVQYMKAKQQKEEKDEMMNNLRDKSGRQNYFTKDNVTKIYGDYERRKVEHMEKLNTMYTKEQLDAMNTTGYVVMNKDQVNFFYGDDSPYNSSKAFEKYINRTERHSQKSIEKTIEMIAKEKMTYKVQRQKDFVLTPVTFNPIILAPEVASQSLILSPVFMSPLILSPSIWGNVILSPWAFIPVLVSPRILGAVVLSPILFSPIVLSPLAMVPVILSPGVGLPLILSPFVLTPFILSPVVLTPLILSPFCLSPFIAVPNVLTPLILSPFVLSPLILSPPFVSAFVLTPYALSPIVKSDGAIFTAVLSPISFLFLLLRFCHCTTSFFTQDNLDQGIQEVEEVEPVTTQQPTQVANGSSSPSPLYPWLENLVNLPTPEESRQPDLTDLEKQLLSNDTASLIRRVIPDDIPQNLNKFLNQTALKRIQHRHRKRINTKEDDLDDDDEDFDEELNKPIFDGEKTTIKITEDAGEQLHQHWIDQGISGLMATVATQRLARATTDAKIEHRKCAKGAKSVADHAKCVYKLIEKTRKTKSRRNSLKIKGTPLKVSVITKRNEGLPRRLKYDQPKRVKRQDSLFRSLKPVNKGSYNLLDEHNHAPFAVLAKRLTDAVRTFKNKDRSGKSWQETLDDIRDEAKLMRKKLKAKRLMKKRMEMFVKAASNLKEGKGAMQDVTNDMLEEEEEKPKSERDELLDEAHEMEKQMTNEDKTLREPIKLIRNGVKLGMRLIGRDTSDFENKTLRMISPKFMSLLEEDDPAKETINLLSPSLFALHNGTKHETLSMTSLMNVFNKEEGHQEWMNFVFEASGVSDAVQYIKAKQQKEEREEMMNNLQGKNGQQNHFTKDNVTKIYGDYERRKVEHMEKLNTMYTKEQLDAMNTTGYVVMNKDQVLFFYGEQSPYNNSNAFERYINRTERHSQKSIETTIEMLAKEKMSYKVQRQKDFVLSPVLYNPIILDPVVASQSLILSPVFMSPLILSPSIWGNVILSPWAFVPVLVSPRILGAVILSPILFSPIILSPLAMTPVILSPGVGLPLILSPFVLTPFILSPVVLTPLILSPFCLSPFIAVPNVLTPLILSPFVLSPLILSPPAVSAFVLTPYALSPIIKSDGAIFTAVLSPSWLS